MKKKLLSIFGPIVLAIGLLVGIALIPVEKLDLHGVWSQASSSMSENVLQGETIKNNAIESGKYVPFFGSSELSRISPFHPSTLAKKYDRGYTPFLLGAPGTQSLAQAMSISSFGDTLENKKVVFVLSPQWFVKNGVKKGYFDAHYSPLHAYDWVESVQTVKPSDTYLARRLLQFDRVKKDKFLVALLNQITKGEAPTTPDRVKIETKRKIAEREDAFFSPLMVTSKNSKIEQQMKQLPNEFDYEKLNQLADKIGKEKTSNNPFEIDNGFYTLRLSQGIKELKDSQTDLDYRFSPEFSDFQLVLEKLAEVKANVLFVLPPVNKKWSDYTGLSQDMLKEWAQKITYQLTTQGFNQLADLTGEADVPYFMQDTIHLGWSGWLAVDSKVAPFLKNGEKGPTYHINDQFLEKQWQEKAPSDLNQ